MTTDRAELMTFQQGEQLKERFDRLLGLLGEEINIHPDSVLPVAYRDTMRIGTNMAVLPHVRWEVIDRDSGRWLIMEIRDATDWPVLRREWKFVYRDPTGTWPIVDRPGTLGR